MEIRTKNKLKKIKVRNLPLMRMSLCYNNELNDYEVYIKTIDNSGIIIQNASNCREICILNCDKDKEVLFAGVINNMDLVNVEISN